MVLFLNMNLLSHAQQAKADSLKLLLVSATDSIKIKLLLELSSTYQQFSPRKALDPALEARIMSSQGGFEKLEAQSLFTIGMANYKVGQYTNALEAYRAAGVSFYRLGLVRSYGEVLVAESNVYYDQGEYSESLNKSLEAYKVFTGLTDKNGMAQALINSGNVHRSTRNYDKSISEYERALNLAVEAGNLKLQAACFNNMSNSYADKEDFDRSIEYLQKAKSINEKIGDRAAVARVLNNLGATYFSMQNYDSASDFFIQALELRKQIGDKRGQSSSLANLGSVHIEKGDFDKGIEYLTRALEIARSISAVEIEINIYESLSEAYDSKGDYKKSLEYYRRYSTMKDSLFDQDFSESIADMRARYDVEKAEAETRAQAQQKKIITWSAVVGGVLLVLILFVLWNRSLIRKRANVRLNQQKAQIEAKNAELNAAYHEIELKNKDITDSIRYAKRIQDAIVPEMEFRQHFGANGFVLFKPKDIVSGDFYWMAAVSEELVLFAAVDCTGHGVPGAFMSLVCSNLLSQAVKEHGITQPHLILNDVNHRLSQTLRQREDESRVRDGMDIALCAWNKKTQHIFFSGAHNPLWLVRRGELHEFNSDSMAVGYSDDEDNGKFNEHEIKVETGDRLYVFTDGFADQFGGEKGKKFKKSRLRDLIILMQNEPIQHHRAILDAQLQNWMQGHWQVDDILILGVEIT
jgi:serine phosphatase RsbU (regulator of sigma subunit)/Tfp pilus assembly protein PilF